MTLNASQNTVITVSSAFPTLAVIVLLLRVRARSITSKSLMADDYWLVVVTAVTVAGSIPYIVGAATACIGVHLNQCIPKQLLLWGKVCFFPIGVDCTHDSILLHRFRLLCQDLFYKRTFRTQVHHFIRCVYATLITVVLWTITFSVATLLQKWPIAAFWDKSVPTRWEISATKMYIRLAITDIFLDIITLVLPLPMIGKLKMSRRNKWALAGVFAIGSFAAVAGIVRLCMPSRFHHNNLDTTLDMHQLATWSSIEPSVGIISASLPLLHPFFKRHAPEAIVGANTAPYGLLHVETDNVYNISRGMSMYLDKVDKYHELVIE